MIDVPRNELDGLFRPLEESHAETAEIVIYDNIPGGAGYSKRIAEQFSAVLQRAYKLVESCSCASSCYDCLRTYTNQIFHHELDRHSVATFLRPIVERLEPDEQLQSFAPDANRVSMTQMASDLDRYCAMVGASTIIYLPRIAEPFTLQRLSQIVETLGSSSPLELILTQLPERESSDFIRFLRKRLSQWIDQGLLILYTTQEEHLPTICFSSQLSHRAAIRFQSGDAGEPLEWLRTRSERGVRQVFETLQSYKANATVVPATALEDPNTVVIFPIPRWGDLTIDQLRQRLGLTQVLNGEQVKKIIYSDRYLNRSGVEILVSLLQGRWLNDHSQLTIQIQQLKEERDRKDTQRRKDIDEALSILPGSRDVKMRPYRQGQIPHRRELTIELQCNLSYTVLFDKGLDFIENDNDDRYRIKEITYIVIVKDSA